MRARFSVPQSRRGLLVAAVALVVVLGGAAAGTIVALRSSSTHRGALARASFPGFRLSFSYPAAWHREDWCWLETGESPITLLTTAHPVPPCQQGNIFGFETPLPPPQRLRADGVAAWWLTVPKQGLAGASPNARVGGEPARITVESEPTGHAVVRCAGATQRVLRAQIHGPSSTVGQVRVGAVICGPDFAAGEADVRRMLASARFTR